VRASHPHKEVHTQLGSLDNLTGRLIPLRQGRRRANESARLECIVASRRAQREKALESRVSVPIPELLARALGVPVPAMAPRPASRPGSSALHATTFLTPLTC